MAGLLCGRGRRGQRVVGGGAPLMGRQVHDARAGRRRGQPAARLEHQRQAGDRLPQALPPGRAFSQNPTLGPTRPARASLRADGTAAVRVAAADAAGEQPRAAAATRRPHRLVTEEAAACPRPPLETASGRTLTLPEPGGRTGSSQKKPPRTPGAAGGGASVAAPVTALTCSCSPPRVVSVRQHGWAPGAAAASASRASIQRTAARCRARGPTTSALPAGVAHWSRRRGFARRLFARDTRLLHPTREASEPGRMRVTRGPGAAAAPRTNAWRQRAAAPPRCRLRRPNLSDLQLSAPGGGRAPLGSKGFDMLSR